MTISLTGCMGSGKSSSGRELARLLSCPFTDLDDFITAKQGRSIPEIFEEGGEPLFRKIELECLEEVLSSSNGNMVLSLGGGTVTQEAAAALIREKTFCVYLRATAATLERRIGNDPGRPMLKTGSMADILGRRSAIYESCADLVFDTDGMDPQQAAAALLDDLLPHLEVLDT